MDMMNKQRAAAIQLGEEALLNKLFTLTEISSILRVSRQTISKWVERGCPCIPISPKRKRFRLADIEEWLLEQVK